MHSYNEIERIEKFCRDIVVSNVRKSNKTLGNFEQKSGKASRAETPWLLTSASERHGNNLQPCKSYEDEDETIGRFSCPELLVFQIHRKNISPKKYIYFKKILS